MTQRPIADAVAAPQTRTQTARGGGSGIPTAVDAPPSWWRRWAADDEPALLAGLVALGCLMEVFFFLLAHRFWLPRYFPGPGFTLGFPEMMTGSWVSSAWWLTIVLAGPFAFYLPALWYARRLHSRLAGAIVACFAVVFGLTLLGVYPITAVDMFHYFADGRTLLVFHQNPMLVPPAAHGFVISISWEQQPSPYGPAWLLLSTLPVGFTGSHWVLGAFGFKLLALLFWGVAALLVYLIVRRTSPGRELAAAFLFAWNPFILFKAVGNGHNDIAMLAFALAALYFTERRRWRLALPALALSILVKYSTVLLVPPLLVYAWRVSGAAGRRQLVQGLGLALGLAVLVFLPFWQGPDTFQTFMQNANMSITSIPHLAAVWLGGGDAFAASKESLVRLLGYAAFAPVYVILLLALNERPSFSRLVVALALTMVTYLMLCTFWFRSWYLLWFLVFVPLLPSFWWTALFVATTFAATFFDLVEQYRVHWPWVWNDDLRAAALPVLVAFAAPLLVLLLGIAATGSWTMLNPDRRTPATLDG